MNREKMTDKEKKKLINDEVRTRVLRWYAEHLDAPEIAALHEAERALREEVDRVVAEVPADDIAVLSKYGAMKDTSRCRIGADGATVRIPDPGVMRVTVWGIRMREPYRVKWDGQTVELRTPWHTVSLAKAAAPLIANMAQAQHVAVDAVTATIQAIYSVLWKCRTVGDVFELLPQVPDVVVCPPPTAMVPVSMPAELAALRNLPLRSKPEPAPRDA